MQIQQLFVEYNTSVCFRFLKLDCVMVASVEGPYCAHHSQTICVLQRVLMRYMCSKTVKILCVAIVLSAMKGRA